jgi:hypothetical protein
LSATARDRGLFVDRSGDLGSDAGREALPSVFFVDVAVVAVVEGGSGCGGGGGGGTGVVVVVVRAPASRRATSFKYSRIS